MWSGLLAIGLAFSFQGRAAPVPHRVEGATTPETPERPSPVNAVAVDVAAAEPVPQMPVYTAPPPEALVEEPGPPADLCADALAWVADAGLPLPAGVGYHCPSSQFPHQGAACWNGPPCRGGGFIAINMDLLAGMSTEYLRHVVAHEVCHIRDFQTAGSTTEAGADACAAAHGAPG